MQPFLTFADNRALREKGFRMWNNRGNNGDAHDNKAVASEILQLRAERAHLLGFPSHAHWIVDDNMAKTPDAAMGLMMKVWKAAVARAKEEVADMQAIADKEGAKIKIEPWDYRYYAEKVRKAKYDIDQNEVKQYLQLDKIREGMFWAAGQVYGLEFRQGRGRPCLSTRHDGLRGHSRRQARRPMVLRPLRAVRQELRRMDERIPHAGEVQGRTSRRSSPTTRTSSRPSPASPC